MASLEPACLPSLGMWCSLTPRHVLLVIILVEVIVCGIPGHSENSCANYSGGHFGHQNLFAMLTLFVGDVSPVLQVLNLPTQLFASLVTDALDAKLQGQAHRSMSQTRISNYSTRLHKHVTMWWPQKKRLLSLKSAKYNFYKRDVA